VGVMDEHWCSICKRAVDKEKEEYLELSAINDPAVLAAISNKDDDPKATRFAAAIVCQACARKTRVVIADNKAQSQKVILDNLPRKTPIKLPGRKQSLWVYLKELRKKGNPNFQPIVACESWAVCETFTVIEPWLAYVMENGVNVAYAKPCQHIALDLKGRLYCKRRHPGSFEVVQEKAVIDAQKREMVVDSIFAMLKENPAFAGISRDAIVQFAGGPAVFIDPDPTLCGADMAPGVTYPVKPERLEILPGDSFVKKKV